MNVRGCRLRHPIAPGYVLSLVVHHSKHVLEWGEPLSLCQGNLLTSLLLWDTFAASFGAPCARSWSTSRHVSNPHEKSNAGLKSLDEHTAGLSIANSPR